jgi:hypothetical protein
MYVPPVAAFRENKHARMTYIFYAIHIMHIIHNKQ